MDAHAQIAYSICIKCDDGAYAREER